MCKLGLTIVAERRDLNKKMYNKELGTNCIGRLLNGLTAKKPQNVRQKYIKLFLHDIWRYGLSFVLIYRGDTFLQSAKSNWSLKYYAFARDINKEINKDVAYLTYWPVKMLQQIGQYMPSEFRGSAISEYMKNDTDKVHVYLLGTELSQFIKEEGQNQQKFGGKF
jgi:arginyl-tRNA--protein-N-Asp/Glu arginylyltransferase